MQEIRFGQKNERNREIWHFGRKKDILDEIWTKSGQLIAEKCQI